MGIQLKKAPKIVLIGSGNVATYLGKAIMNTPGFRIIQIYSPNASHAKRLGQKIEVPYTHNLTEINPGADIYILAINDDAIEAFIKTASKFIHKEAFIVHTSGSVSTSVFKSFFKHYGVFYPLQTFSVKRKGTVASLPILITASDRKQTTLLRQLASSCSKDVKTVSDQTRLYIHLAAVMVNNFPNYWYTLAARLLKTKKIEFEILLPLIEETTSKLKYLSPAEAQTGPAKRHDQKVIRLHEKILKDRFPAWKGAYQQMTKLIENDYKLKN